MACCLVYGANYKDIASYHINTVRARLVLTGERLARECVKLVPDMLSVSLDTEIPLVIHRQGKLGCHEEGVPVVLQHFGCNVHTFYISLLQ
jgi:hypothetical protein